MRMRGGPAYGCRYLFEVRGGWIRNCLPHDAASDESGKQSWSVPSWALWARLEGRHAELFLEDTTELRRVHGDAAVHRALELLTEHDYEDETRRAEAFRALVASQHRCRDGAAEAVPGSDPPCNPVTTAVDRARRREQTFRFMELPQELRLHVYSYLIQSGCTFSITPLYRDFQLVKFLNVVTKIVPLKSVQRHLEIGALMATSRQIQHEAYSILYGENTFVFTQSPCRPTRGSRELLSGGQVEVWSKGFCTETPPSWPIAERSAPYLKSVALLVRTWRMSTASQYRSLQRKVEVMANVLSQARRLESLMVNVTPSARYDVHVGENRRGTQQRTWICAHAREFALGLDSHRQYVLEPLAALHGIQKVSVENLVDPQFAARLASVMMGEKPHELRTSPFHGVRKVIQKRKAGGTKKRPVSMPVAKYWESKYVWD